MKKIIITFRFITIINCLLFSSINILAQQNIEIKCYPTNWWVGMKMNKIQIILHGKDIATAKGFLINYPGITVNKITKPENKNYVFVDISIASNTPTGVLKIIPQNYLGSKEILFELKPRRKNVGKDYAQGVTSKDFIYMLMPDRFSNGDSSNDKFADMNDTSMDRKNPFLRHGGDLKGIQNHLDYFTEIGATALWLTPIIENDMHLTDESGTKRSTYHGYAFTDNYTIDKRFGGNTAYKNLIDAAHKKGLKIMQDNVYNHVGIDHIFVKDMPMKDWLHQWPVYTNTTYKDQPLMDPYAADIDREKSEKGWFTTFMPDLNQSNQFVANYLIENAIWTIEEFGIDGWRIDTYYYSDKYFLNNINTAMINEYPNISVVGEVFLNNPLSCAYYTQNNLNTNFKHNAPGVLDFPLFFAMQDGLKQDYGWSDGVNKVYTTLSQDIVYKNPMNNCIFLDNHDIDRIYSVVGENTDKLKMGLTWLLTLRGIPQMYYGTEILMKNFKNPTDAEVRKDFPGGWANDTINKFEVLGRNEKENEVFNFIKKLANYRKTSLAIQTGKLMQYQPVDGVYVYFRYNNNQTIMVVCNTAKTEKKISFSNYEQRTNGFKKYKNVITNEVNDCADFNLGSYQTKIFELEK